MIAGFRSRQQPRYAVAAPRRPERRARASRARADLCLPQVPWFKSAGGDAAPGADDAGHKATSALHARTGGAADQLCWALFIVHLYWKFASSRRGRGLVGQPAEGRLSAFVPAYVLSAELAGALLLIPGVLTRYVALYARCR